MLTLENRNQSKATANAIADEAGISVTNAYKYLYSLQRKGLIESSEGKNKIFWLSRSSNPFPRVFSYVSKDYLRLKDLFSKLEKEYDEFLKPRGRSVWFNEKLYEDYSGGFVDKAAFLLDLAKDEVLITTHKFFDDIVLLESLKRAIERGVKIRIISSEIDPNILEKLRKIDIEMRLGRMWPSLILVDAKHGITVDDNEKGIWFLNCKTDYKDKFEDFWERSHKL